MCSHLLCAVEASWVCQGVVSCIQSWRCCEGTTLERKRSFHLRTQQIMNHWICTSARSDWKRNVILLGGKYYLLVKKTACGGEQRGACGNAPKSGLIFPLFLPYHWLDQARWMMEGGERRVRGGQNLLAKLSEPVECEEDKRRLCVSYWRAACTGGGKGGCTGREEEGDAKSVGDDPKSRTAQEVYRRFCWWDLMNMYVSLLSCSEDIPPA